MSELLSFKFQNIKLGEFKVPMTKEQIAVTDWLKKKVNQIIIITITIILGFAAVIIIITPSQGDHLGSVSFLFQTDT